MKLIVGLGNPEKKYLNTFHNLGFMCIDKTADILGVQFKKEKCKALIAEYKTGKDKVILAKPLTYMNLSGESVIELVNFFKIESKDLLVIYDDYDLKKGEIRIREDGSAGTHNGMRNIIAELGGGNFARIRVGFKKDADSLIPLIDYVLSNISEKDAPLYSAVIEKAASAAAEFANGEKIQNVMQKYNGMVEI